VIPHIVESEPGENRRSGIIINCPCCQSILIRESKELRCVNKECFEINLQRILAAIRNIGIEELGEPNVRKMMNVLGVKKLADIFNLTIDDILNLEGFKQKSAANLYNSIQKARNTTDYQLLAALNIEGIGQTVAEKILKDYSLEEIRKINKERLQFIPEIGKEISSKLFDAMENQSDILDELITSLNISYAKKDIIPKPIVCFDFNDGDTNKELTSKSKKYYKALAEKHGLNVVTLPHDTGVEEQARVMKYISNVKAYVTNKKIDNKAKAKAVLEARRLGIPVMKPDEWKKSLPIINENQEEAKSKTICFTGKMPEDRSYYEKEARKKGYIPIDTVAKSLSLLVAEDSNLNSSKCVKARNIGVKIISIGKWCADEKIEIKKIKEGFLPGF
jgi:NAD-dependent DNA ligase